MAFTVDDARNLAESWIDEDIADADAIKWANDCLSKLGSRFWRENTQDYDAQAKSWHSLPTGFVRLVAVVTTIGSPAGLTVTPTGVAGATTWGHRVTARNDTGETLACTEVQTTTGNATLSASNYNALSWTAVTGATSYNIYRTTAGGTPSTTGYIGNATGTTFNDTGLAGDSSVVPAEDSSGEEYSDYTIRDRKIRFDDEDLYVLAYIKKYTELTAITGTTGTPDLDDIFKYPMAKFIASRFRGKDDSEDPDAVKWMQEFYSDIRDISAEMDLDSDYDSFQAEEVW